MARVCRLASTLRKVRKVFVMTIFVACCPVASVWAQQAATQAAEVETVRDRCVKLLLSDTAYASEQSYRLSGDISYAQDGAGYYASLTPAGAWPDIDYESTLSNAWPPSWHLYRLLLVSRQYHRHHDPQHLAALHRGLAHGLRLCAGKAARAVRLLRQRLALDGISGRDGPDHHRPPMAERGRRQAEAGALR